MKKTFIVLFDVGHTFDGRPLAESIEGENFEVVNKSNCETVSALRIKDEIIKKLELDKEDYEHVSVYPITDFMDEFNNEEISGDSYFMGYVTGRCIDELDFEGYDVFSDGKCKGQFLGGMGGFIYVAKNGIIDTSFQCDIEEYSDGENSMYGLESIAIAKGLDFEYPILDVSQGDSIMMAHELVEPKRSEFIFNWMERQHGEDVTGIIVDEMWGAYDTDKIRMAYEHFNPIPKEVKVTGADVLNWHGSDHTIEELADVLADIVNGEYEISLAKKEILN